MAPKNILFVTWDGPQTNYLESLFLPIFEKLQNNYNLKFHIIQYTWGNSERDIKTKILCKEKNVSYISVPVFRKNALLGLLKAIVLQSNFIAKYCEENKIDIIMPRATTSACIVNYIINKIKASYLYDADGFSQDERVDFSGWSKNGFKYQLYRYFEKRAIINSKAIICRSHDAKDIIITRSGGVINKNIVTVISNGKDIKKFNIPRRERFKIGNGMNCIYVGSLGPQYGIVVMLEIFKKILHKKPQSVFTILTGDIGYAKEIINSHFSDLTDFVVVKQVSNNEVPQYLANSDLGFALRSQKFSMKGVSPIKLGEYLLCGVPVIATSGIGDTDYMLKGKECAYVIEDEKNVDYDKIFEWCLRVWGDFDLKEQARDLGIKHFDINKTVELYARAIKNIG